MEKVSQFIEKKLKLKVNQDKSQVALSDKVKFLGFTRGQRDNCDST
jgi:RNA-directed DNA polymerase